LVVVMVVMVVVMMTRTILLFSLSYRTHSVRQTLLKSAAFSLRAD